LKSVVKDPNRDSSSEIQNQDNAPAEPNNMPVAGTAYEQDDGPLSEAGVAKITYQAQMWLPRGRHISVKSLLSEDITFR
jgi:hypothetical protein